MLAEQRWQLTDLSDSDIVSFVSSLPLAPFDVQDARSSAGCRTLPTTAVRPGRVDCPRRLQLFQPRLLEQVAALFLELCWWPKNAHPLPAHNGFIIPLDKQSPTLLYAPVEQNGD